MSVMLLQCTFYARAGILIAMQPVPCKRWAGCLNCFSPGGAPVSRATPVRLGFYTRSPARPNPLGLHQVTVREIDGTHEKIGPIEAFDRTPVVDIKSASTRADG
jgi:hypothetical protein